jgi:polysaccharide export outer membrane protein
MSRSDARRAARYLWFSVVVLLLFCAGALAQPPNYAVGPQDVLTVAVFDQPSLSGKFTVEADGTFTFPLVGRVTVGGLSLREVEQHLRRDLEQGYVRNPQVSVAVDQYRSQRVFVVGEVHMAGTYPLNGEMTLIEALARAGSTTDRASGEVVIVHMSVGAIQSGPRLPDETDPSQVIHVNLEELQAGGRGRNVLLRDGDTVFVRRAENVYVFGQVRNPGAYPMQHNMSVLQVLALAGGVTDRGASNRVRLVRIVAGEKQEVKAKLDDLIHPGDTVVVPERFF